MRYTFIFPDDGQKQNEVEPLAFDIAFGLAERGHSVVLAFIGGFRKSFINKKLLSRWKTLKMQKSFSRKWAGQSAFPRMKIIAASKLNLIPSADFLVATSESVALEAEMLPPGYGVKIFLREKPAPDSLAGSLPVITFGTEAIAPAGWAAHRYFPLPGVDTHNASIAFEKKLDSLAFPGKTHFWFRATKAHFESQGSEHGGATRVLYAGSDFSACTQIRALSVLKLLEANGQVSVRCIFDNTNAGSFAADLEWAQVVLIQRSHNSSWINIINDVRQKGKTFVYELDDNIMELTEEHPDFHYWKRNQGFKSLLRHVDRLLVSTSELGIYFTDNSINRRVSVIRNYIDDEIFTLSGVPGITAPDTRPDNEITLGFAGTVTHARELEPAAAAVERLLNERKDRLRLVFIGYVPENLKNRANVVFDPGSPSYHVYARKLSSAGIHIAIAPLEKTLFNSFKSDMKYLEYASCGAAGIYSNFGPFAQTVSHLENGFLVESNTPEAWYNAICTLAESRELRTKIARNAFDDVSRNRILKNNLDEHSSFYHKLCGQTWR